MSVSGIQGQLLEVTVVGCTKLKDTEWVSRQDPYVCLEYGTNKVRTRTCTDGGRNPTFQEKFIFTLIEGLRELNIVVWNSNTLSYDDFIGSGKIPLHKVLSEGFDDCTWPLQTKTGRAAGEARLIMHYANAKKAARPSAPLHTASGPHVSAYSAPPPPQVSAYSAPPPPQVSAHSALPPAYGAFYPPPPTAYSTSSPHPSYPANQAYTPPPTAYTTSSPHPSYPANQAYTPPPTAYTTSSPHPTYLANQVHPPSAYPPESVAYPPPPYPPPSAYPPSPYPPPPQGSQYYPPRHYPGHYPPPY